MLKKTKNMLGREGGGKGGGGGGGGTRCTRFIENKYRIDHCIAGCMARYLLWEKIISHES